MKAFRILGRNVYFDPARSIFSFCELPRSILLEIPELPSPISLSKNMRATCYTVCLNISDACNLRCSYCFHPRKKGKTMKAKDAFAYLESFFTAFPNGERYIVDLSGNGEPLLHLDLIYAIADWCHKKQDEINKEVLPQLVTNGTLLSPRIAKALQEKGVLFGVSLDGTKENHDALRKDAFNAGTYDTILSNVKAIEHREYIGCAVTLTGNVFSLLDAFLELRPIFPTIAFRLARGDIRFTIEKAEQWNQEFDKLVEYLLLSCKQGDLSPVFTLLNGDDLFGRYLSLALVGSRVSIRCDGGIARFAFSPKGKLFSCPAFSEYKEEAYSDFGIREINKRIETRAKECAECDFKRFCGGECPLERKAHRGPNMALCTVKRHLILLALFLAETLRTEHPSLFEEAQEFVKGKMDRDKENKALTAYRASHPEWTFTTAKRHFDQKDTDEF